MPPYPDVARLLEPIVPGRQMVLPDSVKEPGRIAALERNRQIASIFDDPLAILPATMASMADTFGTSLGLLDDNDMRDFLRESFPTLGAFREAHEPTLNAIGDIAGIFIPGTLAVKGIRTTGFLGKLAEKTLGKGGARWITSTGLSNEKLFEENFQRARVLASKVDRNVLTDPTLRQLNRRLLGRSIADVVIENLAADIAIVGSMHQSDFLFPEEISLVENLIYFGVFNAVFAGAGYAAAKYTLTRGLNSATSSVAEAAQNPGGFARTQLHHTIVDERGPAVVTLGAMVLDNEQHIARGLATQDAELMKNARGAQNAIMDAQADLFRNLFKDSPIQSVTKVTEVSATNSPELRTLRAVSDTNPFSFEGVRSLETFVPQPAVTQTTSLRLKQAALRADLSTMQEEIRQLEKLPGTRNARALAKKRNKAEKKQKELTNLLRTIPVVYEIDGTMSAATKRADIFQDGSRSIIPIRNFGAETVSQNLRIRVDDAGRIDFPTDDITDLADLENIKRNFINSENFQKLTHVQKTAVHDMMQAAFERVERMTVTKWDGMELRSSDHHTKFDFAHRLVERFGPAGLSKIAGVDTLDDIIYGSLSSKFREYQRLRNEATEAMTKGRDHIYTHLDNVARALNLPTDNHKLLEVFEANRSAGREALLTDIAKDLDGIKEALRVHAGGQKGEELAGGLRLRGTMQELPRDRVPVSGLLKNGEATGAIDREHLKTQVLAVRGLVIERLLKPDSGSIVVKSVVKDILNRPELLRDAKETVGGVVQAVDYGTITKQGVTQSFRLRDVEAARSIDILTDLSGKVIEQSISFIENLPSNFINPATGQALTNKALFNRLVADKSELNSFMLARNAFGSGWDIEREAIQITGKNGKPFWQFRLSATDRNHALYREMHGPDAVMPEKALLPSGPDAKVPLTMSELAFRAAESVAGMSEQVLAEYNTLLGAQGRRLIKPKPWHFPAVDLSEAHRIYLLDQAGNPRVVLGGATARQARDKAVKEIENSPIPLHMVEEANMSQYFEATGRAFAEMDDFSKPTNQTGPTKGKSFGATVEVGTQAFQNLLETVLRGYADVGRMTRQLIFEPEIQFLKLQKASAGIAVKKAFSEPDNVFDLLISRIAGTQNLHAESIPGKLLIGAQGAYDKLMQRVYDRLTGVFPRFGASDEFKQFNEKFEPEHQPFRTLNEYLQKTEKVKLPPELRRHAGALNEFTTAATIRVADVGMGVINMASLMSTLPPVIQMLNRLPNENFFQHTRRIGAVGMASPNGNVVFSPWRAITSGAHFAFSAEGRRIAKVASERGLFDQFAAETVEIWGRTGEKFVPGILRSLSNKASVVTDKTERWARAWSWMTFYNIGRNHIKLHEEAAMAFAHSQANNVIADFRPGNRPVIFQGAAGMPFGLFTTFMWNFLQRMYHLVETKNKIGIINQVGLHAGLFGAEAVPGVDIALERIGTLYGDGSENLVDRSNRAFGPSTTEFLLNGSIATMSGISIGPRAGIGLPGQMGFGIERQGAGFRMLGRLWDTFWREVDVVQEEQGLDLPQMAEVLARANINKGLSNLIELAQGRSLDSQGNIIETFEPLIGGDPIAAIQEDVRTRFAYGSRIFGFKPLLADELRQENRRNRVTDRIQSELKERLAESLTSKIRGGRLRSEDVEHALENYVRAGGSPENFKRFFQSQIVKGTQNKLDREIAEALNTSADKNRIARLLFLSSQE